MSDIDSKFHWTGERFIYIGPRTIKASAGEIRAVDELDIESCGCRPETPDEDVDVAALALQWEEMTELYRRYTLAYATGFITDHGETDLLVHAMDRGWSTDRFRRSLDRAVEKYGLVAR